MSIEQFIEDTTRIAYDNVITIILSPDINVVYPYDNSLVSGYFDQNYRILSVAKGREDWLDILVHEASHMDQFLEDSPVWIDGVDSIDRYFDWVGGKDVENHQYHTLKAGLVEFDCEKRAVEKIKKYSLPIDIDHYIKKANAYTQFYLHSLKTRKWYPSDKKPYDLDIVLKACKNVFPDTFEKLDPELEIVFASVYNTHK